MMHFNSNGIQKDTTVIKGNILNKYLLLLEVGERDFLRLILKDCYFLQISKTGEDLYLIDFKEGSEDEHYFMSDIPTHTTLALLKFYAAKWDFTTGFAWKPLNELPESAQKPIHIVPQGKFIHWTDEEIDEMLSLENLQKIVDGAKEDWRENAPDQFKNLLDAGEE